MSQILVVDQLRRPLMPTTPARARLLLKRGKAAILRRFPLVLVLREVQPDAVVEPLWVKLDPGSKASGMAVVHDQTGEVVWAAELTHHSEHIREALSKRHAVRRARRSRHTRYRAPRYANHRRPVGWLAPSLLSRVVHLLSWVERLRHWCPIGAISQELVRFDLQALENPEIQGIGYQRGTLFETEVKEYLLVKWKHRCAYCSAGETRLEIDHVHPRSRGGSNRVSNLVLACRSCNEAKADQSIEVFLAERPEQLARILAQLQMPLADAAAVNSTRRRLYDALQACGLPVELGTGGRTRWNRSRQGLPKTHWIDAAAVGASTPARLRLEHVRPWIIEATGRQRRQMANMDAFGLPRGHPKGPGCVQGFKTGDLVRAVVTKGKKIGTYQGRVAVKSDGYFKITGRPFGMIEGIHACYCIPLQRNDGYRYATGKAAFPPSVSIAGGGSAALT
jgi:5-methylcytosine-specific restriction endonuclease McrA